jgi:hypothetical protein
MLVAARAISSLEYFFSGIVHVSFQSVPNWNPLSLSGSAPFFRPGGCGLLFTMIIISRCVTYVNIRLH